MDDFRKKYAVIVGVSRYDPSERIAPLAFAKNDAVNLYQTLSHHCDFVRERMYAFVNGVDSAVGFDIQPPTRANLLKVLKYVSDNATEDDLILLFFAGHGVEISSSPYLVTEDTKMDVLRETAIDVSQLNETLRKSNARCLLRIFDACRSPFSVGRGPDGRMTNVLQLALCPAARGWATISACSSGQASYEDGSFQGGVFSHFLCEGLKGKAANPQGLVTLDGLVDYIRISVGNWADAQTLQQTPHVQSDLSGVVALSRSKTPSTPPALPPENPLADFGAGVTVHLSKMPSDARHLLFTDTDNFRQFAANVSDAVLRLTGEFSNSAISLSVSAPKQLQEISNHWSQFVEVMNRQGVNSEFRNDTSATTVAFHSSEVVVPGSALVVGAARFSFFYWLWYLHQCDVPELQNMFNPNPRNYTGFFTFKADTARDAAKVEGAVREMLNRASAAMLDWMKQLGEFVNGRLDPLRKMKSIIE